MVKLGLTHILTRGGSLELDKGKRLRALRADNCGRMAGKCMGELREGKACVLDVGLGRLMSVPAVCSDQAPCPHSGPGEAGNLHSAFQSERRGTGRLSLCLLILNGFSSKSSIWDGTAWSPILVYHVSKWPSFTYDDSRLPRLVSTAQVRTDKTVD